MVGTCSLLWRLCFSCRQDLFRVDAVARTQAVKTGVTVLASILCFLRTTKAVYFYDEGDGDRDVVLHANGFVVLPLRRVLDCAVLRRGGRGIVRKVE